MTRWKRLPAWSAPYCFAVIQSGLTCAVAAAIANRSLFGDPAFIERWGISWLLAWATMIPVVLIAANPIRRLVARICQ